MDKTLSGTICLMLDCDATCNNGTYTLCDGIANVVRPQIEQDAQAVAIELAARECEKPCDSLPELAARIRALATVPAGHVVVPIDAPISAKPLMFEERSGEWFDASFGFHISLDAAGSELFYTASLGEGDPADFPTLAAAKDWCQNEADTFMKLNAMLAARPK